MIRDEFDAADLDVKDEIEQRWQVCRICGLRVFVTGASVDRKAQVKGFCCAGCEQVWENDILWMRRAAMEGK